MRPVVPLSSWADTRVGNVVVERVAAAVVDDHELCGVVLYRVPHAEHRDLRGDVVADLVVVR